MKKIKPIWIIIGIVALVIFMNQNNKKTFSTSLCYKCGEGWDNICDEQECLTYGNDCRYDGWGKCNYLDDAIVCCKEFLGKYLIVMAKDCGGGSKYVDPNNCYNLPPCSDECNAGQNVCSGNNGFKQCGSFDDDYCLEWNPTVTPCPSGQTCSNGECKITGCVVTNEKSSYKCYNDDIYYYDNCGGLRSKKTDCPNGCNEGSKECIINGGNGNGGGDDGGGDNEKLCPDGSTPELWQDVNKQCKTKSIVWIIGGIFGFMMLMMMMSGMKK